MRAARYGVFKLQKNARRVLDYVLGAALFVLALGLTSSSSWFRSHYPYLGYFIASLITCFLFGLGPANLVAVLAAAAVYLTYAPAGFFVTATQTPLTAASAVLFLLLACNWLLGAMKTSRDRLAVERERYAKLAENRDLLYRELQHRVSNNIQIISGLLLLQGQAVTDKAAKHALTEASARISLIARIQRQLHNRTGEAAPFNLFARELLTDAIAASGAPAVALHIEGGDEPLHEDQATPVSLVLLECVNNALEHAFAASGEGSVKVSMAREGGRHVMTVSDDGKGLPDGFDPQGARSLGLKIVRTMASQIGGDFSMAPAARGVACRLHFPAIDA
jgi:two-component sensor histidine kinase